MRCILFRHGIAVEWHDWNGDDRTRPLTKEGIEKTTKVVKGLLQLDVHPTHLLCSPFLRTQQTAKIAQDVLEISDDAQLCPELLSEASPEHFVKFLNSFSRDSTVLCVGHEPHLGFTAGVMICGQSAPGMAFKKAGACSIYFEGAPRLGAGLLEWWLPPAHLRRLGKD
jgi:phosphohistidine phosphatase